MRRPGRNIPETPPTAPVLRRDHRHSVAVLADPVCHARPPAAGALGPRGRCPRGTRRPCQWLGASSLPCPVSCWGTPQGGGGMWGGGCGVPIVQEVLSPFVHASSRGSSWAGSASALTVGMVLLGCPWHGGPPGEGACVWQACCPIGCDFNFLQITQWLLPALPGGMGGTLHRPVPALPRAFAVPSAGRGRGLLCGASPGAAQ